MPVAYYNETDPFAAQWLRNLIAAGHIAPGDVDERDIRDVYPDDLRGYTQCHFFAGIGVWSHALRRAGWPDDRPVWTGSCPCQPFSAAGNGAGFDDERHLWPAFHHLIKERRPAAVFGEQVASKDADAWIDLVCDDMEAMGYAVGAVPFPAAGVGAPHIRDRLYWMGHANDARLERFWRRHSAKVGRIGTSRPVAATGESVRVADAKQHGSGCEAEAANHHRAEAHRSADQHSGHSSASIARPGPTNGFWRAADWLACRDGKWRPVDPGTFPLVDGAAARVGRLRAYGNAIVAEAAAEFITAAIDLTR